ncbi:MAG: hypothetical protein JST00_28455 [Deltaproteobacteria bacterium]|nr:hypothetical protein [Deltaproteobacteria bacterium]
MAALVLGVTGSSSGVVGCAAERDPINRVQANAIPKSFLVGSNYQDPADDPEFYSRSMVINVPYGESGSDFLMFTNTINSMAKIKWQIQERSLVGRVSFERVDGTDRQGLPKNDSQDPKRDPSKPLAQNDGVVVYSFPIMEQFDIRRDYNPQTGEEANVVVENASDRPWYERDYIRVDFSRNEVTTAYDFDTLSLLGVYNGINYSPINFDIRNPNDPDAPQFDLDSGYFDVTNKLFAEPKMLDVWGMHFPGCLLPNVISGGTEPFGNCNPNEITVRHSFKRVVDTDYERAHWDGFRFEAYGAFHGTRNGYEQDYGLRDKKWQRPINRYNIWERSHYYADSEKMTGAIACSSDADCSAVPTNVAPVAGMSKCDTFVNKCTLPYTARKVKPIVWHYSEGSSPEFWEATREAAEEWDAAMRAAVVATKYAECKRYGTGDCGNPITGNYADEEDSLYLVKEVLACKRGEIQGRDPKSCDAFADEVGAARGYAASVIDVAKMPQMVIFCHGPVSEKDPKECGAPGTVARLGDLRHHLVTNVATPQTNSPWGIMSDSNDPVSGEHVSASINVWTHVNHLFSRGLVDTLRYIGGELKTEDITDGKYIDAFAQAAKNNNGGAIAPIMSEDEIDKRIASAANTTVAKLRAAENQPGGNKTRSVRGGKANAALPPIKKALLDNMKKVAQTTAAYSDPSYNAPIYQARMDSLKGTPVEASLITPAMQQLAQAGAGQVQLDPNTMKQAVSIVQGMNPTLRRHFERNRELALAARGACIVPFEATAPIGYIALGDILQDKFGKFNPQDPPNVQLERAEKMKDWMARRAQYAVIAHEMGHSFALRHNFVSSSDAWNFRPQYWQLRTNDKKLSNTPCKADGTSDGKTCVGPRWLDPVTANESKNMIHMWSQSSTMEYPGEPSQDLLGLGAYDFGAARMFYGDTATVYTDAKFKNTDTAGTIAQAHQGDFGGLLGMRYGDFSAPIHYSQLDGEVGLIKDCKRVDVDSFKPANWDEAKNGKWNPVVDGHIVTNEEGVYTKCKQPEVDFVQWTELKDADDKSHAADAKGRVRVPHGFASDDWADLGNVAVFRHDNGADLFETMHFWISQQEMTHIFSNYRRGRRDFSIWGAFNRTLGRYHEKMRDSAKAIGLYTTLARDTVSQYGSNGTDPEAFVADVLKQVATDNTVASSIAFDHFAHVFSRPQPGEHGQLGAGDPVLRSFDGTGFAQAGRAVLSVANGVQGGFGAITLGGRPIENALARDQGRDYDRDYTNNVGSYYEKAFTAMLFTESADNFISSSRDDFVDPRFRAVSLADVFPDGYRRWLANNLTNDDQIKGVYVRGTGGGAGPSPADLDPNGYALLGQTSWWPTPGADVCFAQGERLSCRDPFATSPVNTTNVGPVVDPQIGWEQQKFALVESFIYLPENARLKWIDQMRVYVVGSGLSDEPGFENRIEFHDPDGRTYIAQTYGTEVLFGKTVQKGIAARVLEYANELLQKSVVTAPIVKNGVTIGYQPVLDAQGKIQYRTTDARGNVVPTTSCETSKDCTKLRNYVAVPKLMMEAAFRMGFTRGAHELKGVY